MCFDGILQCPGVHPEGPSSPFNCAQGVLPPCVDYFSPNDDEWLSPVLLVVVVVPSSEMINSLVECFKMDHHLKPKCGYAYR